VRFEILGPLRVWDGATWSEVTGPQPRAVLAILLIEAGRAVTTDRLVDEVWGERPPGSALNTIHGYVLRLRRMCGTGLEHGLITRGHGYELAIEDDDIDAGVFARLIAAGRNGLAGGRLEDAVTHLSQGLMLWRGPALADVPVVPSVAAEVARLEQQRLASWEARLGAELGLGRHAEVVDELARLVRDHPLRERLRALLMQALYRSGRRTEALDAYRAGREVCATELGLEPGRQLRELERAMLAGEPSNGTLKTPEPPVAPRTAPAQLPSDVDSFTGRAAELRTLDRLLWQDNDAPVVTTITGVAGSGKTALAVHWAHRIRDRFPDGQLAIDLRGCNGGAPVRPIEALAGFLRALGIPPAAVPTALDEATALFRSVLADRRVLVLLDNAGHPGQVRPLLPANPGCLVVITSRRQLAGLIALDGATHLALPARPGEIDQAARGGS